MVHRRRGDVIAKKATIIAVTNQKGGTGKTTTCENLGIGLAMEGKKVLLVDADPQGSLTISMGWQQPDELPTTLSTLMAKAMNDQPIQPGEGVLHHAEGGLSAAAPHTVQIIVMAVIKTSSLLCFPHHSKAVVPKNGQKNSFKSHGTFFALHASKGCTKKTALCSTRRHSPPKERKYVR